VPLPLQIDRLNHDINIINPQKDVGTGNITTDRTGSTAYTWIFSLQHIYFVFNNPATALFQ